MVLDRDKIYALRIRALNPFSEWPAIIDPTVLGVKNNMNIRLVSPRAARPFPVQTLAEQITIIVHTRLKWVSVCNMRFIHVPHVSHVYHVLSCVVYMFRKMSYNRTLSRLPHRYLITNSVCVFFGHFTCGINVIFNKVHLGLSSINP